MLIDPLDPSDPSTFRKIMGHHPTGVAVITSSDADQQHGLVVGSFTSISLAPPLVGFFPGKASRTWAKIEATGRFCANVLAADQAELCKAFAGKQEDKFAGLTVPLSPAGLPILPGTVAWIDCVIDQVCELGDHFLVVGAVQAMGAGVDGHPLVFARGNYHGLASLELA